MRKAAIVALVAVGSSLALYAGIGQTKGNSQKTQTECCDKIECCPMGSSEECCELSCE